MAMQLRRADSHSCKCQLPVQQQTQKIIGQKRTSKDTHTQEFQYFPRLYQRKQWDETDSNPKLNSEKSSFLHKRENGKIPKNYPPLSTRRKAGAYMPSINWHGD